jgi:hypothetical protein
MTVTLITENNIVQCPDCKLIHAYSARKRKSINGLFTLTVCPHCECQAYRNTEIKIEQDAS